MQSKMLKEKKCILLKNDIEIWIDTEQESKIINNIKTNKSALIVINDKTINKSQILGIYTEQEMDNIYKAKKGLVQCPKCGKWNGKFDKCPCEVEEQENQSTGYYDFPPLTKVVIENKSGLGDLAKRYTIHTIKGYKPYTEFEIGDEELKTLREHNRMVSKVKLGKNYYPFVALDLSSLKVKKVPKTK